MKHVKKLSRDAKQPQKAQVLPVGPIDLEFVIDILNAFAAKKA